MITIVEATENDYGTIRAIAHQVWPVAYGEIISKMQLDYMLEAFYNDAALKGSVKNGHRFLLAVEGDKILGFASYQHNYRNGAITKIPKIYILPETQGKGIGKSLIDFIENLARQNNAKILTLNVNRFNKALHFYQRLGFKITAEEDIEIGNGYLMEDYVMEKEL